MIMGSLPLAVQRVSLTESYPGPRASETGGRGSVVCAQRKHRRPGHFHFAQRSLPAAAVSRTAEAVTIAAEAQQKTVEIVMIGATMNDISGCDDAGHGTTLANARVRLFALGYAIAAAVLRFKDKPALRLTTAILAVIFLATTLLLSDHVSSASLVSSLLFLAVNLFQILLMLWDLRPVALQGEARVLHDFVFPNLTASDFNKLMLFAQWRDGEPGDRLAIQGSGVTEIVVLLSGHAEVERDGQRVSTLGAGAIIGQIGSLSAQPFSSTIRLAAPSRYLAWNRDRLDHFFACRPSIASGFERAFISRLEAPVFRLLSRPW
jgi:Cyclic nucleotide-binding domain